MEYHSSKQIVIQELQSVLQRIDEEQVLELVDKICSADKVFVVGVGRVLLMLQAFVKRLNHLGIHATHVGAIDEPAITDKDVLIVGSGSGESVVPLAIVKVASKYNAYIAHIGSNQQSSMTPYENLFVRIPCQTKLDLKDEIKSEQVMSSLFEQSLLLLADIIAMLVVEKKGIQDVHSLWKQHANLE